MKVSIEQFDYIQLNKIIGFINSLKKDPIEGDEEDVLNQKYANDVSFALCQEPIIVFDKIKGSNAAKPVSELIKGKFFFLAIMTRNYPMFLLKKFMLFQ